MQMTMKLSLMSAIFSSVSSICTEWPTAIGVRITRNVKVVIRSMRVTERSAIASRSANALVGFRIVLIEFDPTSWILVLTEFSVGRLAALTLSRTPIEASLEDTWIRLCFDTWIIIERFRGSKNPKGPAEERNRSMRFHSIHSLPARAVSHPTYSLTRSFSSVLDRNGVLMLSISRKVNWWELIKGALVEDGIKFLSDA